MATDSHSPMMGGRSRAATASVILALVSAALLIPLALIPRLAPRFPVDPASLWWAWCGVIAVGFLTGLSSLICAVVWLLKVRGNQPWQQRLRPITVVALVSVVTILWSIYVGFLSLLAFAFDVGL